VGCAVGASLLQLKRDYGCDIAGIEPCKEYAAYANKMLGEGTVVCDMYENVSLDQFGWDGVDVIISTDFIEHLVSPTAFLTRAFEWLSADGVVFMDTPEYSEGVRKEWYFQLPHPVAFTRDTLSLMVKKCGFGIRNFGEMDLGPEHTFIYIIGEKNG